MRAAFGGLLACLVLVGVLSVVPSGPVSAESWEVCSYPVTQGSTFDGGSEFEVVLDGGVADLKSHWFHVHQAPAGFRHAVLVELILTQPDGSASYFRARVWDAVNRVMDSRIGYIPPGAGPVGTGLVGRVSDSGYGFASPGWARVTLENTVNTNPGPELVVSGRLRVFEVPSNMLGARDDLTQYPEVNLTG